MNAVTPQNSPPIATAPRTITEIIARAAESPNFDVDKLERLIALKDQEEAHQAALHFNDALAAAQGEMGTISHDAENRQTNSKYATFAQLDRAIRPIYTRHGFGIQFSEEPSPNAQILRVIAFLSCGRETRRYMRDIPITTTGIRGQAMATLTHANMSAATYGRRALLTMMFNLSTDDDDGNAAGKTIDHAPQSQPKGYAGQYKPMAQPKPAEPPADPVTGEIGPPVLVPLVYGVDGKLDWQSWGAQYIAGVRLATCEADIDLWESLNGEPLDSFKKDAEKMFARLAKAVADQRLKFGASNEFGT